MVAKLTQCPTVGVPYLIGDSKNKTKRTIFKARCKLWDCPYCAELNKSQHINRIANGIFFLWKENVKMQFVTITCHEKWRGTKSSVKNWRKNKDKLLARVRRFYAKNAKGQCDYVYLPEYHKDKTVHIHGIFCGDFGSKWWKDNARESGLGFMAKSAPLESILQAINYITKYITKEMGKGSVIKGFRRICYSQGFRPLARHENDYDWIILGRDETIESAILEGLLKKGYDVFFDNRTWSTDDFL